jgi:methionyl-tRNA formyltransferase
MRVVFIGTGEIGVPTLQALLRSDEHQLAAIVTQPDKPLGATSELSRQRLKWRLPERECSILQPARIKDRQSIERSVRCRQR